MKLNKSLNGQWENENTLGNFVAEMQFMFIWESEWIKQVDWKLYVILGRFKSSNLIKNIPLVFHNLAKIFLIFFMQQNSISYKKGGNFLQLSEFTKPHVSLYSFLLLTKLTHIITHSKKSQNKSSKNDIKICLQNEFFRL